MVIIHFMIKQGIPVRYSNKAVQYGQQQGTMLESVNFVPAFTGSPWLGLGKHGGIKVLQILSFGAEQPHSSLLQSSTMKLSKNHKISTSTALF